jgi:hypothetical protein
MHTPMTTLQHNTHTLSARMVSDDMLCAHTVTHRVTARTTLLAVIVSVSLTPDAGTDMLSPPPRQPRSKRTRDLTATDTDTAVHGTQGNAATLASHSSGTCTVEARWNLAYGLCVDWHDADVRAHNATRRSDVRADVVVTVGDSACVDALRRLRACIRCVILHIHS